MLIMGNFGLVVFRRLAGTESSVIAVGRFFEGSMFSFLISFLPIDISVRVRKQRTATHVSVCQMHESFCSSRETSA